MNDRFLRACWRQPVDATPVWFLRQAGRSLPEYRRIRERATLAAIVADPALCTEVTLQPVRRLGVDAAIVFADITTPLPGIGVAVELVDGVGPVVAAPLRSAADVAGLRPFDAEEAVGPLLAAIRLLRDALDVPLIGFAGGPFTVASYLVAGGPARDAVALRTLVHAAPAVADDLLGRVTTMTLAYLRAQVAAGAQAVQVFDSWIGSIGPFAYERAVLPHMRRLFAGLAGLGVPTIHFATGAAGLLAAIADAGGDVIGLDWRVRLADAWERLPGRAVQGNLDPATLLGPWDGIEAETRWVLAQAAGRDGHVFNLGHGVLPSTDPDRLARVVDLVHEVTARTAVR